MILKILVPCLALMSVLDASATPEFTISGTVLTSVDMRGESEAVIPDGVTCILDYAFRDCLSLISVAIPASVEGIGAVAFEGCCNLSTITLEGDQPLLSSDTFADVSANCVVRLPRNNTTYWNYVRNGKWQGLTVEYYDPVDEPDPGEDPDPIVWTITDGVLTDVELNGETDVTIPDSVTRIEVGAFRGCHSIEKLTIPASVTSIDAGAFNDCSGLVSFVVVEQNPTYKFQSGYLLSKNGTTLNMWIMGTSAIPSGVEVIGDQAFLNCSSITSVTIPSGVMRIGYKAFYGCDSLTKVTIPDSVIRVGVSAFDGCNASLYDTDTISNVRLVDGWVIGINGITSEILESVNLSGVRGLGDEAFHRCTKLTSVVIPASVKSIGASAFSDCTKLTSVVFEDGVLNIGADAFGSCFALSNISISDSVKSIDYMAFAGSTNLINVTIPNSVTNVGHWAFLGCSGLSLALVPSRLNTIVSKSNQFAGCASDFQLGFYDDSDWLSLAFDANGGTIEPSATNTSKKCVRGYAVGPLPTTKYALFQGWYTEAKGGEQITPETIATENMTLYAHWEPRPILVYAMSDSDSQETVSVVMDDATNSAAVFVVVPNGDGLYTTNITFWVKDGFEVCKVVTNGVNVVDVLGKRGVWTLNVSLRTPQNLAVIVSTQLVGCDQIPALDESVSPSTVSTALVGVVDTGLTANVTNAVQYGSYRTWALSLTNKTVTVKDVKTSRKTWLSYALGVDALIEKDISSDDMRIESFTPNSTDGKFDFSVGIDGVNVGSGLVAEEMLKENLKKVFGLEGGTSPEGLSASNVDITFGAPENGKVKFTAGPNAKNASSKAFFMRVKMTP